MNAVQVVYLPWGTRTPEDLRRIADAVERGPVVLTPEKQAEVIRLLADVRERVGGEVRA